jgi:dTDP-4-dehydrorhamnose reductase
VTETVYITGGSGLLALNWAITIREDCRVVLGMHNRRVSLGTVETRALDLETVDAAVRAFSAEDARLVIHTAGLTSVESCEKDPELARHLNVDLSENVARACRSLHLPLVHISTDHLFSGDAPLATEDQPTAPVNVYGRTKADGEQRVLAAHPDALVVRTNFYGWGLPYRPSFSDTILTSLRGGASITLFQDVFYTPILIENLVHAVHELVDRNLSGIFNVVADERISKCQFGYMLASYFDLDPVFIRPGYLADKPDLVQRPHDMSLSNEKVRRALSRNLGGPDQHIVRLREQERLGIRPDVDML